MLDVAVRVSGIPAVARVLHYLPEVPARLEGHPDWREPAYGGEITLQICDRRGRPAPWLERKLSRVERLALEREVVDFLDRRPSWDD